MHTAIYSKYIELYRNFSENPVYLSQITLQSVHINTPSQSSVDHTSHELFLPHYSISKAQVVVEIRRYADLLVNIYVPYSHEMFHFP